MMEDVVIIEDEGNPSAVAHVDVVEHTIVAFIAEVARRSLDGWAISPTCPGDVIGYGFSTYTVSMYRSEETLMKLRYAAETLCVPKLNANDRMAKARAAKAANKLNN